MKRFYVIIDTMSNEKPASFSVTLPEYFKDEDVKNIISRYTKYNVEIINNQHKYFYHCDFEHFPSMEKLLKAVKSLKLYMHHLVTKRTTEVEEVKEFIFPTDWIISETLEIRDKTPLTFFTCSHCMDLLLGRNAEPKFNHDSTKYLRKALNVKCSCKDRLYLVGDWEIVKRSSMDLCEDENGNICYHCLAIKWKHSIIEETIEI